MNQRFPSLDGLRAAAILLVILQHLSSGHTYRSLDVLWRFEIGDLGVRIFFVISGFLITSLMRKEFLKSGRVNLRNFYMRRVLRIFPAYYFFLAVLAIAALLGNQALSISDFWPPVLYLANYLPTQRVVAHTWSLAVEEQFYLLWPVLVVLAGWRRAAFVALLFLICAPLLRTWVTLSTETPDTFWGMFQHAGDTIAWGCLYALVREGKKIPRFSPYTYAVVGGAASLLLGVMATMHAWPLFWNSVGIVITNVVVVVVLHCALEAPQVAQHRLLNLRWVMWIGTLSYSLYLWQQVFIYVGFKLGAPMNVVAIVLSALASHYLIERPFLTLKGRMMTG